MNLKSVEKPEVNTAVLEIEVTADEFEVGLDQAYRKARHDITVPGFRKGKAPRKVIEAAYGAGVFYEDAVNLTFPKAYAEAVVEAKLDPVDQPNVELVEFPTNSGYVFKATVTLYPEITLGEYKGLSAERKVTEVTDADIDREIERLRERNARLESADKAVENGDVAVIDFEGFVDGVPFEGGKAEKYNLYVGSGSFVPGFEDQVVGMKEGEEKDINITFPEGYNEELGGKDAVFKVKVHDVKQKILPDLDDEFVKDVSEFDTLDQLRDNARKKMTETAEAAADEDFINSIMDKIVDNASVELPKVLVENQMDLMMNEQEMMLQQQGMSMEKFAEMVGQTVEQIRESARPTAEKAVKTELALNRIAELENLEVSDEELEEEYKQMADMYKVDADTVKKSIRAEDLRASLLRRKAQTFVRDNSIATEPKPVETETDSDTKAEKKDASAKKPATKKPAAKKTAKSTTAKSGTKKPTDNADIDTATEAETKTNTEADTETKG